ncbi:DUF4129 domain-containing protein [Ruania alkalisoli]|uniref:DUF4129 domain-containing protein n=1 Tax=Ruania alkalisoli TaxID=2779775 RepID=A0A7M1SXU3_9MICO|nr:DUF4129 domain-containing protein [Ruania alkalisoli]QOR71794.1 DUF4129 domain-containing protein [Ruania alkalisoli]
MRRPRGAFARTAAVGVLVSAAVLAAAVAGPWQLTPRFDAGQETPSPPPARPTMDLPTATATATPPPLDSDLPTPDLGWLLWVGAGVLALVLLALLVRWVLWWRRPHPPEPEPPATLAGTRAVENEPDIPALHRGAQAAVTQLEQAGPPRDAIVAAWLALEEAAEATGVHRRPAQTPTEFTTSVLARTGADEAAVTSLLGLYHQARFSTRAPGTAEVRAAAAALTQITESWPAPASVDAGPATPPGTAPGAHT